MLHKGPVMTLASCHGMQVLRNSKAMADRLMQLGYTLVSGGRARLLFVLQVLPQLGSKPNVRPATCCWAWPVRSWPQPILSMLV